MTAVDLIVLLEEAIAAAVEAARGGELREGSMEAARVAGVPPETIAEMGQAALGVVADGLSGALVEIERWRLLGGGR